MIKPVFRALLRRLRSSTLQKRVLLVATIASTVGFGAAGAGLIRLDIRQTREAIREEAELVAATVAHDARSSLMFEDRESAQDALDALSTHPDLIGARITDTAGNVFATLEGPSSHGEPGPVTDRIVVTVPIAIESTPLGEVTIETGLRRLRERRLAYATGLFVAIVAGLFVAVLVALPLQRLVGRPLLQLAASAERVRLQKGPGRRVPRYSDDELGQLTDSVNRMLEDLHRREEDLRAAKAEAVEEAAVAARQAEVAENANRELREEMRKRRELQQQLERSQRIELLGQMAGGVAHDVNNALTVILGWADLGRMAESNKNTGHEAFSQIETAARQASKTTGQLLAFARNQLARPRPVDPNEAVQSVRELAAGITGEEIEVLCSLSDDAAAVMADPGQLEQVLMNLIVNAQHAIGSGGTITLRTANAVPPPMDCRGFGADPTAAYVMIAVEDTGVGMTPEVQQRLFEPFFTTKEVGQGTGLGLAVCYRMVKAHRGVLTVESQPGVGSAFRVYLPQASSMEAQTALDPPESPRACRPCRILIVEDEESVRSLMGNVLRSAGHDVQEVSDGLEAMSVLDSRGQDIELVISDVRMPHVGGAELERTARSRFPNLRVLLISGYHDEQLRRDEDDSTVRFLPKPFRPAELLEEVRSILE